MWLRNILTKLFSFWLRILVMTLSSGPYRLLLSSLCFSVLRSLRRLFRILLRPRLLNTTLTSLAFVRLTIQTLVGLKPRLVAFLTGVDRFFQMLVGFLLQLLRVLQSIQHFLLYLFHLVDSLVQL